MIRDDIFWFCASKWRVWSYRKNH